MANFLMSPEGAKIVSATTLGAVALIYAMRFGLSDLQREKFLQWVRIHLHIAN